MSAVDAETSATLVLGTAAALVAAGPGRPRWRGRDRGGGSPRRRSRVIGSVVALVVCAVAAVGLRSSGVPGLLALLALLVAALGVRSHRGRLRRRADSLARSVAVGAACAALAADLEAGAHPERALRSVAELWPVLAPAARAARWGADVPTALREIADLPGAEALRTLAAGWRVAAVTGAGLASLAGFAAQEAADRRDRARRAEVELTGALATVRLLLALPAGMLLLARSSGGDPLAFLLGSVPGAVCLLAGISLVVLGLFWLDRVGGGIAPE